MPGFGYGRSGAVKRMLGRSQGEKERFPRPQAPQPKPAMPVRPQPPTLPPQASERAMEAVAKTPPTLPPQASAPQASERAFEGLAKDAPTLSQQSAGMGQDMGQRIAQMQNGQSQFASALAQQKQALESASFGAQPAMPGQMLAQGIPLDREAVRQQEMEKALQAKQRAANPELQALFQSLRSRMV